MKLPPGLGCIFENRMILRLWKSIETWIFFSVCILMRKARRIEATEGAFSSFRRHRTTCKSSSKRLWCDNYNQSLLAPSKILFHTKLLQPSHFSPLKSLIVHCRVSDPNRRMVWYAFKTRPKVYEVGKSNSVLIRIHRRVFFQYNMRRRIEGRNFPQRWWSF